MENYLGSWLAIIAFPPWKVFGFKVAARCKVNLPGRGRKDGGSMRETWRGWFSQFPDFSAHNLMNLIARPILACTTVRARSQRIESLGDKAKQRKLPPLRLSKAQRETWTTANTQSFSPLIRGAFFSNLRHVLIFTDWMWKMPRISFNDNVKKIYELDR